MIRSLSRARRDAGLDGRTLHRVDQSLGDAVRHRLVDAGGSQVTQGFAGEQDVLGRVFLQGLGLPPG